MTEVVVIGAGIAGASAAWRLAQAGHAVTVLERGTPANALGSSHGSARILRYAYADPRYVELMLAADPDWHELEAASGTTLVDRCGGLDHGAGREPERLAALLQAAGVEHELLNADDAGSRWGVRVETTALWQPTAGVLDAEGAVHAMLAEAERHGARVLHDRPVERLERRGAGYRVHGAETVDAEQVVVAVGGWLPDLLHGLELPRPFLDALPAFEVRQEQAFHFPYRDGEQGWPTLIHDADGMLVYALPGGRDAGGRGQKVAEFAGGHPIRSAAFQDGRVDPANRDRVVAYVERHLPGLVPEPYAETTCLFTSTPDEAFVIDRADGVTVLSACSGHGAKFAPLLGRLALDLVEGRPGEPAFRPSVVGRPSVRLPADAPAGLRVLPHPRRPR